MLDLRPALVLTLFTVIATTTSTSRGLLAQFVVDFPQQQKLLFPHTPPGGRGLAGNFVSTVKDVRVNVPAAIRRGDSANLICHYDMEGAVLYTVKWYKGKREFFRYTPKENPSMKAFPVLGITVERSKSNGSHLTLTAVEPTMSGKYSCEVSADSPSFHTMVVSGEMEVVALLARGSHLMVGYLLLQSYNTRVGHMRGKTC
ncbi:conserved hypothetical protein [Culex quinquefasciatus]|uniref:Ig-like domain-containing protein n=1 Tax=Culex quinquefasciatus TaxID=7176 RepID=B0W016_CULQU|nr:conserved hypothetical protein [Culex quinquefasciatus]|eukprot:XP_001842050.1 conserved hypothetical protein [Culex quinquefasciatus]